MGRDSREVATTSQEKIRRTWSGERGGGGKRRREPSSSSPFASPSRFSHQFLRSLHINRELSKDVLEQSTSTGSEAFSFLICLDATRFIVLSVFTHIRRFAKKLGKKHCPRMQKVHFRLTWIAQKRLCLNSLLSWSLKQAKLCGPVI